MADESALRDHLARFLDWDSAHLRFDDAVKDFPPPQRGVRPPGAPHSAWELLEHIRLEQWDILEFSRDANHASPEFPKGYWPKQNEPGTPALWQESIDAFRKDLEQMEALVADPATDLYAKIPHGDGQTILREALLIADHNAYHLGVLTVMSRIVKSNPGK